MFFRRHKARKHKHKQEVNQVDLPDVFYEHIASVRQRSARLAQACNEKSLILSPAAGHADLQASFYAPTNINQRIRTVYKLTKVSYTESHQITVQSLLTSLLVLWQLM